MTDNCKFIDCIPLSVRFTIAEFAQCLIFWLATIGITLLLEACGLISFPSDWFLPYVPFIGALVVAAATFTLEFSYIKGVKNKPMQLTHTTYKWGLRSCNKNIGAVCINTAAIFFWMFCFYSDRHPEAVKLVLSALAVGWFSALLQQLSLAKEKTSLQT